LDDYHIGRVVIQILRGHDASESPLSLLPNAGLPGAGLPGAGLVHWPERYAMLNRRRAIARFAQFLAASPLMADRRYSERVDPLLAPANVFDFAKLAKAKMDPLAWDYVDEASEDEGSLQANRTGFGHLILRPHFLDRDVSKVDISTTLFGHKLAQPLFLCPTGGKNCVMPAGEKEAALGAGSSGAMMITSGGIDDVLQAGKGPKVWWQFTTAAEFRSKDKMADFGRSLKDRGCAGISVTVDIYHVSHRERSIHNGLVRAWCNLGGIPRTASGALDYKPDDVLWSTGEYPPALRFPTPTWDTLQQLHEAADMPVIVKGVMTAEDTEKAVRHGLSGVIVSNHGARQLDQVGGTIEALPECVQAANGKIPVLLDGGIRRGTDILKALALGASAVGIGRPYLWGMAAFGNRGVARVVELLRAELATDMGMAGLASVAQIDRSFVRLRR
jgi:isopentenyl diphosphate isomerase/L-lactate dehydrogenase-like FMN-dependent dehydrogenase